MYTKMSGYPAIQWPQGLPFKHSNVARIYRLKCAFFLKTKSLYCFSVRTILSIYSSLGLTNWFFQQCDNIVTKMHKKFTTDPLAKNGRFSNTLTHGWWWEGVKGQTGNMFGQNDTFNEGKSEYTKLGILPGAVP